LAPPHVNEEFMKASPYGQRVAHGAMPVGYDRVRFTAPVYIGDTIKVSYTVKGIEPERRRSRSSLEAVNQRGEWSASPNTS
jgi:acyl dehydratase